LRPRADAEQVLLVRTIGSKALEEQLREHSITRFAPTLTRGASDGRAATPPRWRVRFVCDTRSWTFPSACNSG
jgi:hypothetical protein